MSDGRSYRGAIKGLRLFLDEEQQRGWLDGDALRDGDRADFHETIEQRFKYAGRFQKLLELPQAADILDILRTYVATCLPIPRTTERFFWSVSCLPGSPDKPLIRVNASWMELFALHADGDDLRARFIVHLSDFTRAGSDDPERLDESVLEQCVAEPGDVSHAFWRKHGILIAKVRGAASIRRFMETPHGVHAIRRFNLSHMNRGRNAYQASHCYSLADAMLDDGG